VSSEAITQRVVLLFGSGSDSENSVALASESSRLVSLLEEATGPIDVRVISLGLSRLIAGTSEHVRLDESGRSRTDNLLTAVGAFALRKRLAAFPIGRLLNSIGPVDQGRVFSRTVRRNSDAMRLLRSADVVIAADLIATKVAWLAVHRGWVDNAYFDRRSASVGIGWQLPSAEKGARD